MCVRVLVGSLLWSALVVGIANAQTPVVVGGPAYVTSSPTSPKTELDKFKIELLKDGGMTGSVKSKLYSTELETNGNFARGTFVVVPAERANNLLKLQTDAITDLSERLRAIETRLEALEKNKGQKK
ncbi:MAG: hypothetical protein ABI893_11625 [Polaromonas sp.]|uniref:hypothetical protein n=1 Tax=Polaromonas sp. TaxID=1869339 RepID=UPI003266FDC9